MTKTLLVTGATSGFGRATVERFVGAGWLTALAARDIGAWHLGAAGVSSGPRGAGQTLSFHRDLDRMHRLAGWDLAFSRSSRERKSSHAAALIVGPRRSMPTLGGDR